MSQVLRAADYHQRYLAVINSGRSFAEEAKDAILAIHTEFDAPGYFSGAEAEALRWLYETLRLYDAEKKRIACVGERSAPLYANPTNDSKP